MGTTSCRGQHQVAVHAHYKVKTMHSNTMKATVRPLHIMLASTACLTCLRPLSLGFKRWHSCHSQPTALVSRWAAAVQTVRVHTNTTQLENLKYTLSMFSSAWSVSDQRYMDSTQSLRLFATACAIYSTSNMSVHMLKTETLYQLANAADNNHPSSTLLKETVRQTTATTFNHYYNALGTVV